MVVASLGRRGVGPVCEDVGICHGDMLENWISMYACAMGICFNIWILM